MAAWLRRLSRYGSTSITTLTRKLAAYAEKFFRVAIVPEWRLPRLDEERHLTRLFHHLNVDCVFDVGANVGQYGLMLRKYLNFHGLIISFEPNPEAFQALSHCASHDTNWVVEPMALARKSGEQILYVHTASEFSSFHPLEPSFGARASLSADPAPLSVPVETLSSYLERARSRFIFERPFLKIDTQGSDMDVIMGAENRIKDFVGIQSELSFFNIYKNTPCYEEQIKRLNELGFLLSRLTPIHDAFFPLLYEMNGIFVRSDFAENEPLNSEQAPD